MANGTTTIDYEYNSDGLRTKKTVTMASNHTHVFQSNVVAPTCTQNGHTLHVCSCGYIYQDSPVAATGHTFTTRVVDSTCTANGYVLKECSCGYSYQEGSNGHNFTTLVVEPTETVNGFTRHTCECGYSYESDPVVSLCTDEGAELPATADTKVYDYVYNGSSLTYLTITTTNYGESPVVETLYFGNGTVTYNGTVYYYVTNLQGDIVAILDTTGTAVVEYTYDAWGNILTTTGTMATTLGVANPLTYRGYVYDAETSLYYLQSRYYNPKVGRFINADALVSTGQGMLGNNMFAYALNNPIIYIDITGERVVGIGLQFEVQAGDVCIGIELIVYFDPNICNGEDFALVAYTYSGASFSSNDLSSLTSALAKQSMLIVTEIGAADKDALLLALLSMLEGFSLSGGVFVLDANEEFTEYDDYSGAFDTISASVNINGVDYTVFKSSCSTCSAYGLKAGVNTKPKNWFFPIDFGYSRTYYSNGTVLMEGSLW